MARRLGTGMGMETEAPGRDGSGFEDRTTLHLGGDVREHSFLSTDIVGSSALHRRHPDDMMAAMDMHDEILTRAIHRRGGVPFKHTGDGIVAVFDTPMDATFAAIEAQLEMRAVQWNGTGRLQVRWGVHVGFARARGDDFFGLTLATVNRLESAANGDQILVSDVVVRSVGAERGAEVAFLDLGEHHFKGVERLRVYQVLAAGLPGSFAPISGKRENANGNLPANLSSFVGREAELQDLRRMAVNARALTLLGPGGIGKTRLAVELARRLEPTFPDGAWIVQLSTLEREGDIWPAIAETLSIPPVPGAERRLQVLDHLQHANAILVMDNCEHVLEQATNVVAELGSACEALWIVATSRHTLGVAGEVHYKVPPLSSSPYDGAAHSTAVQLFVDRARLTHHRFDPNSEELHAIERICDSLEHIPLAIEIAAGQLRRFPLAQILRAADNPLDLWQAKVQRNSGRQKTLRRTMEWSYELLDPSSRRVLELLSVFSGPFHEEQALAVCAGEMHEDIEVLDGIDELIESSLLNADVDGERRISMLQSVQAFGREKLEQDGRLRQAERRHGEVFAARCRDLGAQFAGEHEREAVAAIMDDLANIRTAFERALTRDLELAAEISEPLFLFGYFHRGAETGEWAGRIMARPGAEALPQAPLLLAAAAGHMFHERGDADGARALIERGLAAEAAGGRSSRGWLSHMAGQIAFWSRRPDEFMARHAAAVAQARRDGDLACEIVDTTMATLVHARLGNLDEARALVDVLGGIEPSVTAPSLIGYIYFARGGVTRFDDVGKAIEQLETAVEWARIAGNQLGIQRINGMMATIKARCADPREALAIQVRALSHLPERGATFYVWNTISRLLQPLFALGWDEHLAFVAGTLQSSPLKIGRRTTSCVERARARLGADAFDAAVARGRALTLNEARAYLVNLTDDTET
ncbi:MAG: putative ATPase/class 3 adenylate cyclase [Paracoccaceae bacterium]|jgi:predicted ATPase/class 3 adenylate cyclase